MCYKVPHVWACGHTYAWSPVHCAAATAQKLKPSEHCEHLMEADDPNWKIKEDLMCPDCQKNAEESPESDGEGEKEAEDQETGEEGGGRKGGIAHELAALELEISDLETSHLEHALRESAHHHTLQHEEHLEQAKKNSLADAPEQQSLENYAEEMSRAREMSQRHWEEELGMGVYRDHEEAVQRARMESYRELLEGYRRLKQDVGKREREGEAGPSSPSPTRPGSSSSFIAAPTTPPSRPKSRRWRWPFQDDDHRQLYEDDEESAPVPVPSSTSTSRRSSARRLREAADPAESHASRGAHASASHQPATTADAERPESLLPPAADDGAAEANFQPQPQRRRPRSLLKKLRPSGGGGDKK